MKTRTLKLITVLVFVVVAVVCIIKFKDFENSIVSNQNNIRCIDGDTFEMDGEVIRLLAIDSPEYTTEKEKWGKEASEFTCRVLMEAETITLESDYGNEMDVHGRSLYWVFVDDELLQKLIVAEGLAKTEYIDWETVNTNYLWELFYVEIEAEESGIGIWSGQ